MMRWVFVILYEVFIISMYVLIIIRVFKGKKLKEQMEEEIKARAEKEEGGEKNAV